MYGVELLVEEHKNILLLIDIARLESEKIISGKEIDTELFREFIDFGRNYADKHHHGKEEQILFKVMLEELGEVANKLIKNGMYVEHDLGRLYLSELEEALNKYEQDKYIGYKLDIIANVIGYGNLLRRHIEKEDKIVYTYAERELSNQIMITVDEATQKFESQPQNSISREKYINWLNNKRIEYNI
ncbi:MAG: hemerythrin domain-containing protein [Proteocatella sp.]